MFLLLGYQLYFSRDGLNLISGLEFWSLLVNINNYYMFIVQFSLAKTINFFFKYAILKDSKTLSCLKRICYFQFNIGGPFRLFELVKMIRKLINGVYILKLSILFTINFNCTILVKIYMNEISYIYVLYPKRKI